METEKVLTRSERVAIDQEPTPDNGNPNPSKCYGDIEVGYPYYRNGRRPLEIPVSKENITVNLLLKYLPSILRDFQVNVESYNHLHDVYSGKSNIRFKNRAFDDDGEKENTRTDEKHAYYMVEFKKGYMYGNDVKYSCADADKCTDEVTTLSEYMKDENKATKNVEIAEDVYVAGAGNRLVLPKRCYVKDESPFEIFNLKYCSSFIVYSSNYTGEKLFGGIITTKDGINANIPNYELLIYSDDKVYTFRYTTINSISHIRTQTNYLQFCPFIEYKINKSRIGIVELVEPMLDAINVISSNSIDNVIDFVNSILVIENQKITEAILSSIKKNGALTLKTGDPSKPAKASYLANSLDHGDVNVIKNSLKETAYSIAGVPLPTTKTTSGGDTGQARELGGGYVSADTIANQDEICLKAAETEMNTICIAICKKNPDCPITTIRARDIEVNFNRRKNDNLLVKAQALKYLYDMRMPKEIALNYVGISANSHEDARAWEAVTKEEEENAMNQEDSPVEIIQDDIQTEIKNE